MNSFTICHGVAVMICLPEMMMASPAPRTSPAMKSPDVRMLHRPACSVLIAPITATFISSTPVNRAFHVGIRSRR